MDAQIISMAQWKAAHPPALMLFNHGLACALAWQRLWLSIAFPRQR
ncbi:MAG: hypothetical protein ABFC42_09135 [Sulfuricella sp.]